MSFEITGKLHKIYETENKTETFRAREFVIETPDGSYTNHIKFQLVQDRCSLMDDFQEGEDIKVHFDLRGREWNSPQGETKYFNSLDVWKIERVNANDDGFRDVDEPPPHDDDFLKDVPF